MMDDAQMEVDELDEEVEGDEEEEVDDEEFDDDDDLDDDELDDDEFDDVLVIAHAQDVSESVMSSSVASLTLSSRLPVPSSSVKLLCAA